MHVCICVQVHIGDGTHVEIRGQLCVVVSCSVLGFLLR